MGRGLRTNFFISFVFTAVLILGLSLQPAFGQLNAGDIAFTGFNEGSPDGFAVVFFKNISAGQEIHFSEGPWDGTAFDNDAGDFTWTAPSGGVSGGTVLTFSGLSAMPSVNVGSITDDNNINISGLGSVIYAYTGTDKRAPNTPLLGAIANSADKYNGTEGNLSGTGLTQGTTAILLPDNTKSAKYTGDRSGNTPKGYRGLLNNIDTGKRADENWDIFDRSDEAQFSPFDDTRFVIVSPPAVAFSTAGDELSESSASINITVELVEATGTAVDADVSFVSASSTADLADIGNYSTQTVSFSSTDTSGTTQSVVVSPAKDNSFEGREKAIFKLENNTTGSITGPRKYILSLVDSDKPALVFNEINANPGDDANGDGEVDSRSDTFIEWVNNTKNDIDISGWTYSDDHADRFTFPDGTVIAAENALILFDSDEGRIRPSGSFGGAFVFSARELGLNQSPGTLTLKDEHGVVIETATFNGGASGQSNVLSPEVTGTNYVNHSSLSPGTPGALSSPGTKADGTAFGSRYAASIRGSEGWRMISAPTANTTFNELFGRFRVQGINNSEDPSGEETILSWDETDGGSFTAPSGMSSEMKAGKGYIVYVFEDDDLNTPGMEGGFPKTVNTDNPENISPVSVSVTANDSDGSTAIDNNEGWNLLGNPFGTDLFVDALMKTLKAVDPSINANVYVWNPATASFKTLTGGDTIAPFQAFFVRYTAEGVNGEVNLNRNKLAANSGATFYKDTNETVYGFDIKLKGTESSDPFKVSFSTKGEVDLDRYDAYKLFSLNPDAINLYGVEGTEKLLRNELPNDLDQKVEIPLGFVAPGRQELRFQWKGLRNLPPGWTVKLIDRELNQEVDLLRISEYKFTTDVALNNDSPTKEKPLYAKTSKNSSGIRFVLAINPGVAAESSNDKLPNAVKLNPNYPNPFNSRTRLSFELAEKSDVTLTVWNMIGQKVTTLVDGTREAGKYTEDWNASNMPSGIYIARFEVGSQVFTRKMTLIK